MIEAELNQKIKECKERKKHYENMVKWAEDYKLAMARSIITETYNIDEYKKKLKELRGER